MTDDIKGRCKLQRAIWYLTTTPVSDGRDEAIALLDSLEQYPKPESSNRLLNYTADQLQEFADDSAIWDTGNSDDDIAEYMSHSDADPGL